MSPTEILLKYVIDRSYTDKDAQDVLDAYDSARTGISLAQVKANNARIRASSATGKGPLKSFLIWSKRTNGAKNEI